ncbi:MAG TPA: Cys-tRNA(Pro) deacylase [Candidatus Limnocylindrales bacterium]|nr:Cys-tRNA(Pro) deacylase [Candidatus Limnocylindrales bacterium]
MAAGGTRALAELVRAGVVHTVHEYAIHEPTGPRSRSGRRPAWGDDAAEALGVDPGRIHKTLIAAVDGGLAVAVVPVAAELDLKALARALGAGKAAMADPAEAERATGYVRGGISPLGQRRRLPTVVDAAALELPTIVVSAGRRGLQVELSPGDLVRLSGAVVAPIARRD